MFALVLALCTFVHAQTDSSTTRSEGFYAPQEVTLPEGPTIGELAAGPALSLPDLNSSSSAHSDAQRMPSWAANGFIQTRQQAPANKNLKWRIANQESLLFTGVMHTFNVWTEPGTRDTLNGHWLQQYLESVGELRGWSDSDRFMAPYVGHTIEG